VLDWLLMLNVKPEEALREKAICMDIVVAFEVTRASEDGASSGETSTCGEPRVLGGVTVELYPQTACGLVAYMVVDPTARGQGVGTRLLKAGREALSLLCALGCGRSLAYTFLESHNPLATLDEPDVMDPSTRLLYCRVCLFCAWPVANLGCGWYSLRVSSATDVDGWWILDIRQLFTVCVCVYNAMTTMPLRRAIARVSSGGHEPGSLHPSAAGAWC
jgi:GNAT superfamily N-acetyltransferase